MKFQSKTMTLNSPDTVPYLTYNSLSEINFINHAFSTRLGGVSEGEFTSMNMAFNRGDNPESVTENYKRICKSAGFDFDSLTASAQDHNTFVRAVTSENKGVGIYKPRDLHSVDALITNEKGVTLVTYYADCTPLFFVDIKQKAIGLAHAGWRGTVGRIGEKVVKKMTELYGTNPADIVAAIGPAISVCCYEVDTPVYNAFKEAGIIGDKIFRQTDSEHYRLDIKEANRQILINSGILPENIDVADICTCCNSDSLHSHRATGGERGNLAAIIELI